MAHTDLTANPFALMMAPEAIFAAIERSERLGRLKSRICRPLDGPRPAEAETEVGAFDEAVEAAIEAVEESSEALDWPEIEYESSTNEFAQDEANDRES
ncbi:MAG: hypothetical protein M3Y67_07490 [Pseudomonadota bacterium]|nr:hypothetical protein [Pseudomonadota bacterium]